LRREQLVELQVSAVRHSIAEIGDHPVFEGHGRPSITRAGGRMRGAAALLLAFTACAGEEPAQSIPG